MEINSVRTYTNSVVIIVQVPNHINKKDRMHEICEWGLDALTGCIEIHSYCDNNEGLRILCEFEEDATLVALKWG